MANSEHVAKVRGCASNSQFTWARAELIGLDLAGADLRGLQLQQLHVLDSNFSGANLDDVSLGYSEFHNCKFVGASLRRCYLGYSLYIACSFESAMLHNAYLAMGTFSGTVFTRANLTKATASWANFRSAVFDGADMQGAILQNAECPYASFRGTGLRDVEFMNTTLTSADFTGAMGLDSIKHRAPSLIDFETMRKSGPLPVPFLRGCGLPDEVIEFGLATAGAKHFYSCFISYADADKTFVDRLYADLQNNGVRCWYSPEDLKIGAPQRATFSAAIHVHDKLLLVLSKNSLFSSWVESEVETALERERKERRTILFPVRLDDDVLSSSLAWAEEVRRRHIGDFRKWKDHDSYQTSLARLLRDLKRSEEK